MCGPELRAPAKGEGRSLKARRRFDAIPARWHCSIVGTCLGLVELRKLAVKAGLPLPADADDYRVHGAVVHTAGSNKVVGRLLARSLDKRYATHLSRFARAGDEAALAALWGEHLARGDVPGAYWALMTHPADCHALRERAYGEVHMLSHLSGATQRADLARAADLEKALAERAAALARAQGERTEARARLEELTRRLAAADLHRQRAEALEGRLAALEDGSVLRGLRAERDRALAEAEAARTAAARLAARQEALEADLAAQREAATAQAARIADLELRLVELAAAPAPAAATRDGEPDEPEVDLGRRRILYVGGRDRTVAHFAGIVARCNGEFIHHDGGFTESCPRLTGLLETADAVLCPVTCVSHEAMDHVKKSCRRACKRFVPLPTPGLSAFVRALKVLGSEAAA